jgi:protein FAM50
VNVDNLLYIKEDLIIPHVSTNMISRWPFIRFLTLVCPRQHYTFYDFIINKARGKSGPLFNFDVHDDVRLVHDATVEKDEVGVSTHLSRRKRFCDLDMVL